MKCYKELNGVFHQQQKINWPLMKTDDFLHNYDDINSRVFTAMMKVTMETDFVPTG